MIFKSFKGIDSDRWGLRRFSETRIESVTSGVASHPPHAAICSEKVTNSDSYQTLTKKILVEYLSISDRPIAFLASVERDQLTPVKSLVICDLSLGIFSQSLTDGDRDCVRGWEGRSIISPKAAPCNQPTSMFSVDLVCASPSTHSEKEYILKP